MAFSSEPVTLSVEQIRELHEKLVTVRHDVNNELAKMAAAIELIRRKPESVERIWSPLAEEPRKVSDLITKFSNELEAAFHITRP